MKPLLALPSLFALPKENKREAGLGFVFWDERGWQARARYCKGQTIGMSVYRETKNNDMAV